MRNRLWSQLVAIAVVGIGGLAALGVIGVVESAPAPKELWKVALLVYDDVELLDLAGPGEVFASSGGKFEVYTVAETTAPIISQNFLTIQPEYSIDDAPLPDILVVPGGGIRSVRDRPTMMAWLERASHGAEISLSICNGAFLLAEAGLLEGAEATTFYAATDALQRHFPDIRVHENVRWVDNGSVITTAGVSAGIDGSLRVVAKLLGADAAVETASYMQYEKWEPTDGLIVDTPVNRRYQEREAARLVREESSATELPLVDGIQQITIVVGDSGFEPNALRLRRGVPTRLVFDRQTESACAAEVKIPDFGIAPIELPLGTSTTIEFTPDKTGRYHFACGMDMLRGALLIENG